MALSNYKYGFNLQITDGNIELTSALTSPAQLVAATDQDYDLDIAAAYVSEIASIESVQVQALTTPCGDAVSVDFTLLPDPEVTFSIASVNTITVGSGSATNIDSYFFEHRRGSNVLTSASQTTAVYDANAGFSGVANADVLRAGVELTNGVRFYRDFTITNNVSVPFTGTTGGSRVDENSVYYMNSDRTAIDLTASGFGTIDGVYAVKVTATYTDINATPAQTAFYIKGILRDESTDIPCQVYDLINTYDCDAIRLLAMHESLALAISCDKPCDAYIIWGALTAMASNKNCNC